MTALALKRTTVVEFPGGRRVRLDSAEAARLVQSEILRSRRLYKDIALNAELCAQTVAKIACGDTKRPSFNTIAAILGALGWTIFAERS